jgi:hypothetical protein
VQQISRLTVLTVSYGDRKTETPCGSWDLELSYVSNGKKGIYIQGAAASIWGALPYVFYGGDVSRNRQKRQKRQNPHHHWVGVSYASYG